MEKYLKLKQNLTRQNSKSYNTKNTRCNLKNILSNTTSNSKQSWNNKQLQKYKTFYQTNDILIICKGKTEQDNKEYYKLANYNHDYFDYMIKTI